MLELLKANLAPLGGVVVDQPSEADFQLFINAPAFKQGVGELQWAAQFTPDELLQQVPEALKDYAGQLTRDEYFQVTQREMQTPRRSPEEFCRAVVEAVQQGKKVPVADVAFVNGSDLILGSQLIRHPEIARLVGYGGWNTAGNTLGTVLAQAAIYLAAKNQDWTPDQRRAHLEFLFLRFIDDYCYQALERSLCMLEDLPAFGLLPTEERLPDGEIASGIEKKISERLDKQARQLEEIFQKSGLVKSARISNLHLPWQRLFEISFEVKVELA